MKQYGKILAGVVLGGCSQYTGAGDYSCEKKFNGMVIARQGSAYVKVRDTITKGSNQSGSLEYDGFSLEEAVEAYNQCKVALENMPVEKQETKPQ